MYHTRRLHPHVVNMKPHRRLGHPGEESGVTMHGTVKTSRLVQLEEKMILAQQERELTATLKSRSSAAENSAGKRQRASGNSAVGGGFMAKLKASKEAQAQNQQEQQELKAGDSSPAALGLSPGGASLSKGTIHGISSDGERPGGINTSSATDFEDSDGSPASRKRGAAGGKSPSAKSNKSGKDSKESKTSGGGIFSSCKQRSKPTTGTEGAEGTRSKHYKDKYQRAYEDMRPAALQGLMPNPSKDMEWYEDASWDSSGGEDEEDENENEGGEPAGSPGAGDNSASASGSGSFGENKRGFDISFKTAGGSASSSPGGGSPGGVGLGRKGNLFLQSASPDPGRKASPLLSKAATGPAKGELINPLDRV